MNTKQRLVLAGCATIVLAWTAGLLTVDATDYPQRVVLVSVRCDGETITEKVVIMR